MRSSVLPLVLPLLLSCGKVVTDSEPSAESAGAPSVSPAGRDAPQPEAPAAAGTRAAPVAAAGRAAIPPTPTVDAGATQADAGKPAAADSGADEDAGTSSSALCDGSDALRLGFVSEGGFLNPAYGFTNPHGHSFIAIDGKCRFYSGDQYMRGIVSGTLSPADAAQLSSDLHWNELDSWAYYGFGKDGTCPDAGVMGLMKAGASAGCSCGCDSVAPSGLGDALQKAHAWVGKLRAAGKPLDGPVSAVVLDQSVGKGPKQPVFDWPLARSIESTPNLILEPSDQKLWMGTGPWARFDEPAEYAKLREMRQATVSADTSGSGIYSQAVLLRASGKQYDLYVRDELPASLEQAWKDLKSTVKN